jgi:hypothetical protein
MYYACQQAGVKPEGSNTITEIHGVQSMGITTNFTLTQVFEFGQLAIYDNIEEVPDLEVTLEKILDGYPLIWHLATMNATSGSLVGRSNQKTTVSLAVFADTQSSTSGVPIAQVDMSGMVVSSLSYSFQTDSPFKESVTLVGNNKLWNSSSGTFNGAFPSNADAPIGSGGSQVRHLMVFDPPASGSLDANGQLLALCTVLPTSIYGINSSGINQISTGSGAHIQSINISCDLGRDQILELGRKAPYFRYVTFPVEVTTEITFIGIKWDGISATEAGGQNGAPAGSNLRNQSIRVFTKDGTFISTGTKNKLKSVSLSGGDTGGGNVSITHRYITYNELYVKHPADPTTALIDGLAV